MVRELWRSASLCVFTACSILAQTQYHAVPVFIDTDDNAKVTVGQLSRKLDKNARKEFNKAFAAEEHQDLASAVRHLRAAIRIQPDFPEACNNLGIALMSRGDYEDGLVYLRRAVEIDPFMVGPQVNIGSALAVMDRPTEAEVAVRRALKLDGQSLQAHLVLGVALLMQSKAPEEAIEHLRKASQRYPDAHSLIARLQHDLSRTEQARTTASRAPSAGNQ